MFKIGDKVVHPYHGAGKVIDIEEKKLLKMHGCYYIIDLVAYDGLVMVPTNNIQKIGLRRVSGKRAISRAMNTLTSTPDTLSSDHRERQARAQEKLNTGDLIEVTEVMRNLGWRNHEGRLTMADNKIYQRAQTFLASELSLARGIELQEALNLLRSVLNDEWLSPAEGQL